MPMAEAWMPRMPRCRHNRGRCPQQWNERLDTANVSVSPATAHPLLLLLSPFARRRALPALAAALLPVFLLRGVRNPLSDEQLASLPPLRPRGLSGPWRGRTSWSTWPRMTSSEASSSPSSFCASFLLFPSSSTSSVISGIFSKSQA